MICIFPFWNFQGENFPSFLSSRMITRSNSIIFKSKFSIHVLAIFRTILAEETSVRECCVIPEKLMRILRSYSIQAYQAHFQLDWRKFQTQQGISGRLNAWLKEVFVTQAAINHLILFLGIFRFFVCKSLLRWVPP